MGGLGWVGLGQGLSWSPTHGPRRLPCGTQLGGRTRVSGHKAYRTLDRPQTPRSRSRAGDAAVPVCMCPCVSEGGGGGGAVAHLLVPLLFGVGAHGAGKCVPSAPGPGREAREPNAEPAGGDVGLGLQPPRHKDKLPNRSTTAYWHGKAVVRGTTGVRPALLDCLRHRWCCHVGWVWLPTAEGVPRAGGGAPGRRECFPALGCCRCWLHRLRRYSPRRRGGPEGTPPEWPLRLRHGGGSASAVRCALLDGAGLHVCTCICPFCRKQINPQWRRMWGVPIHSPSLKICFRLAKKWTT